MASLSQSNFSAPVRQLASCAR